MSKERFDHKENREMPELLSGENVAELTEKVFEQLSPETRCHLVDSNVVLGMAGLKPQTEFFVDLETNEELLKSDINMLNRITEQSHPEIRFRIIGKPIERNTGDLVKTKVRAQMISLENLRGYERASRLTNIPGIEPFAMDAGWEECEQWWRRSITSFKEKSGFEQLSDSEREIAHSILAGFMKGYPDAANYDFANWLKSGKGFEITNSNIPFTGLYSEAQPNYFFRPENANDPSITKNIADAGTILREFYGSDFHKKVEPSLASHKSGRALNEEGRRVDDE